MPPTFNTSGRESKLFELVFVREPRVRIPPGQSLAFGSRGVSTDTNLGGTCGAAVTHREVKILLEIIGVPSGPPRSGMAYSPNLARRNQFWEGLEVAFVPG